MVTEQISASGAQPMAELAPPGERARRPAGGAGAGLVVLSGSLEAVAVRDGQFTSVLRGPWASVPVVVRFPDSLRHQVWALLCRQVVAEGWLRRDSGTGRLVLELRCVRGARPPG